MCFSVSFIIRSSFLGHIKHTGMRDVMIMFGLCVLDLYWHKLRFCYAENKDLKFPFVRMRKPKHTFYLSALYILIFKKVISPQNIIDDANKKYIYLHWEQKSNQSRNTKNAESCLPWVCKATRHHSSGSYTLHLYIYINKNYKVTAGFYLILSTVYQHW